MVDKDIIERLCKQANSIIIPDISETIGFENTIRTCILMFEAAHEIEKLRSLLKAIRNGKS